MTSHGLNDLAQRADIHVTVRDTGLGIRGTVHRIGV
jgi:hypothetical protein